MEIVALGPPALTLSAAIHVHHAVQLVTQETENIVEVKQRHNFFAVYCRHVHAVCPVFVFVCKFTLSVAEWLYRVIATGEFLVTQSTF